jgi:predicted DNA-binding protein
MPRQAIYEALKKDHETVQQILQQMVETTDRAAATRGRLLGRLRKELLAHAHAEERLLYHELEGHKESHDIALEAEEEHHAVEMLLAELANTEVTHEHWKAKATVLKEMLEHHIEEEEQGMFATARELMSEEQAVQMADQFQQEKREEQKHLH